MGNLIQELKEKVLAGNEISKEEALALYNLPEEELKELCEAADEVRAHFCNNALICALLLMEKVGVVQKTVSSAHSQLIIKPAQSSIHL